MTNVVRFDIVLRMKNQSVAFSSKYQVVIPKAARKKMEIGKESGQRLIVDNVTKDTITFRKEPSLEDFLGKFGGAFGPNANARLRKMRDEEWE